jgi:uncharacterized protein YjdB
MASTLVAGDVKTASVKWVDARGNDAAIDEADQTPRWASSNEAVMTAIVADGVVTVTAVAPGTAQLTVTVDADRDAGEIRELVAMEDVTVIAAEAVAGTISLV